MKLSEIKTLSGLTFQIIFDGDFNQLGMATSVFQNKGVLAFLSDSKYKEDIINNKAITCLITTPHVYEKNVQDFNGLGIILYEQPKKLFYQLHNILAEKNFYWKPFENDIDSSSSIDPKAILMGHSIKIGKNCIIEAGVIIHPGVIIGDDVTIRSGSVIGSNGFQFLNQDKEVIQVKSAGMVKIHPRVEIQHLCCIDRGVLGGDTILHEDVKIDNLVQIAHDCIIKERTLIAAGVIFGGRTIVGEDSWIGLNATVSNGLVIGDHVRISLGSVVTKNIESGKTVSGNFAIDHERFLEHIKSIR